MSTAPDLFLVEGNETHAEQFEADEATLKTRRWLSDVLAVLPSVMGYLHEQFDERLEAKYGREGADEIWREAEGGYRALIDAARRADQTRSLVRRFSMASWQAECYRRRVIIPKGLELEEEKRRKETLARSWRRCWSSIHRLQRVTGLAFFERAVVEFHANRDRKAADYIDNLTDLLAAILREVRERGGRYGVPRFRLVTQRHFERFVATREPYAAKWKPGQEEEDQAVLDATAKGKRATPGSGKSPTEQAERVITRAAGKVAGIASSLPAEEVDALGLLFLERLNEQWKKQTGRALPSRRVLVVAGDSDLGAGAEEVYRADPPGEFDDFPAKFDESAEVTADCVSAVGVPAYEVAEFDPEDGPRGQNLREAEDATDAFASVGVERLKVVFVDDTKAKDAPDACTFAEAVSVKEFRRRLPGYLERNARLAVESMTVRAHFKGDRRLIQFDDGNPDGLALLAPFSFIQLATSPGSGQAWIALADALTLEQYDEVRYRLLNGPLKATGANGGPYGASRWPGSMNRKPKRRYVDGESPRVQLLLAAYGRRVAVAELEASGLLAPPRQKPTREEVRAIRGRIPDGWPDMDYYLAQKGNRSDAEAAWCVRALSMGWPRAHVEAELARRGDKASGRRGDNYVRETVDNAARYLGTAA